MTKPTVTIVIPWRDRGTDPLRKANMNRVIKHWLGDGSIPNTTVSFVNDGRKGNAQFNRSAAYNRAIKNLYTDIVVFTEADMLIPNEQIGAAVTLASQNLGLVVPFDQYRYLSPEDSIKVRENTLEPENATPEYVMDGGRSIGAINVVSRETLAAVGQYDETFEGAWYDDNAMQIAFEVAAGPTQWINGPAYHLYHLPGGPLRNANVDHLTEADRAATARNKARFNRYRSANTPQRIRELTAGKD